EDLVGYGPTANCFEGQSPGPTPSDTTADWRMVNGCQDTNQNINDFVIGAPKPRNTAVFGPCTAFQLSAASYTASEASPRVDITVTRMGETGNSATVSYATNDDAGPQNCNIFN